MVAITLNHLNLNQLKLLHCCCFLYLLKAGHHSLKVFFMSCWEECHTHGATLTSNFTFWCPKLNGFYANGLIGYYANFKHTPMRHPWDSWLLAQSLFSALLCVRQVVFKGRVSLPLTGLFLGVHTVNKADCPAIVGPAVPSPCPQVLMSVCHWARQWNQGCLSGLLTCESPSD